MAVPWFVPIFRLITEARLIPDRRHHFGGEMLNDLQHLLHACGAVVERQLLDTDVRATADVILRTPSSRVRSDTSRALPQRYDDLLLPVHSAYVFSRLQDRKKALYHLTLRLYCKLHAGSMRVWGVTTVLLRAAVEYAEQQGAKMVEGYPIEAKTPRIPAVFAWTGLASAFRQAGFVEVQRRSDTRPIMRYVITDR
jgi:hypothetical protein